MVLLMIDTSKLPKNLPLPDEEMSAHSLQLSQFIRDVIDKSAGAIPFEQFMHLVLYSPGLGYYSAGSRKFGAEGDFVTAPEISAIFSQCLARNCQQVLAQLAPADILEVGAGTGVMARDILAYLESQQCLPEHYFILEVSADLRARQRESIAVSLPHLLDRVVWLDALPQDGFRGVVVGNEVIDAMPVHLFRLEEEARVMELYVEWRDEENGFAFCDREIVQGELFDSIVRLKENLAADTLYPGYLSEVNLQCQAWLKSIANMISEGVLLLVDYGFPAHEYYHPDRKEGTLMCHYRHHSHDNPLLLLGLQDITAHVDFSALASGGRLSGLDLKGYTSQAQFLLSSGLDNLVAQSDPNDIRRHMALVQEVKKLVMPNEMGELFKVIAMSKNFSDELMGFAQFDLSDRL